MSHFIGREVELGELGALLNLKQASLCVIKGRRRIGKSRLLSEFAKYFENAYIFSGLAPEKNITAQDQRDEFVRQLKTEVNLRGIKADDWGDLFWHLSQHIQKGSVLIILDEITWMGDKDPTFLAKLKNAWDLYFSKNSQLVLAISGSLSAWIDKNILSSTGYLGRISLEMDLEELPLEDCIKFWGDAGQGICTFEKLKVLAVTGGVPRYLENINPHQSAEENIRRLCFVKNGIFSHEFKKVFSDLYDNRSAIYEDIVRCLADGIADQESITEKINLQRGGKLSMYLEDLTRSGFISRDHTWLIKSGKYSKLSKYRLKDNYSRFYLKYIQPNIININMGNYQNTSMNDLPAWHSIMALQIENLILSNRHLIKKALNITNSDIICDNPYFQRKTTRQQGCQIDYMIQTRFNTLFICEIKYSKNEITTKVIDEVKEKIKRLRIPKHFSYRPVLIHANTVSHAVTESNFFTQLIDITQFFE